MCSVCRAYLFVRKVAHVYSIASVHYHYTHIQLVLACVHYHYTHIQLVLACVHYHYTHIQLVLACVHYHYTHRPAPTGEQRWLPAFMLVIVGHARCSSHRTRDHRWPCVQFDCSSNMEQFTKGSAVFQVTGHFSTPPEN